MIEEKAMVVALQGEQALMQTQRRSTCQSCSVKQGCGTSVLAEVVGKRSAQFSVQNTLSVQVGDEVMVGINENVLIKASFMVYALPLIFLLLAALMGEFWAKAYGYNAELSSIIAGIAGFLLAMVVTRYGLFNRRLKQEIQPRMLRVTQSSRQKKEILLAL